MNLVRTIALTLLAVIGRASAAEWVSGSGHRFLPLPPIAGERAGFTLMATAQTGIHFTNLLGEERGLTNQIFHNGAGVALGDVDGDGRCDIYLGNIDGPNALYRNLGGWRFTNIAAEAGVACERLDTSGVLFADVDGDGDLDLLVNATARGTTLFLNDGQGRFTDATATAGTAARAGSTSLAMGDIDGDGDLDLYVANYRITTLRDEPFTRFKVNVIDGRPTIVSVNDRPVTLPDLVGRFSVDEKGGIMEHGEADVLFRNEGGGRFARVAWTNGAFLDEDGRPVPVPYDFGLSVMVRDLNADGAPDIYVCNDFDGPDRIWMNRGDGRFQLISRLALRQTSLFSMGVDVADIDRDGHDDIFVLDMLSREHTRRAVQLGDRRPQFSAPGVFENRPQSMRNTLFWNRGDGTYAEIAPFAGLEATEWSWTPLFLDVDLDGYEDLLVVNGHQRDGQNLDVARQLEEMKRARRMTALEQLRLRTLFPRLETANVAFRNGGALRFADASAAWGFNATGIHQGMAAADLDNDGDLDVIVTSLNGPPLVYRNDATAPRLAVRLRGRGPNTRGVGARIRVLGGPVPQSQEMMAGGRYLSSDDYVRTFAAGSTTNELTIEVMWRSGRRSVVPGARANRIYEIDEVHALPASVTPLAPRNTPSAPGILPGRGPEAGRMPAALFTDVSAALNHTHHENAFNDFERQPLLARKLSQPGPGVTWFDVDGDGSDDLLIGSGAGRASSIFRNRSGRFEMMSRPWLADPAAGDQTAIVGMHAGTNRFVVVAESNYEHARADAPSVRIVNAAAEVSDARIPGQESSAGPIALADVNGDGSLDLFVGGRVIPARYPAPASSALYRGTNDQWLPDAANTAALTNLGLVTSAGFSDLNADGWPDLILALEWGPIRIFRNERGTLAAWDPPVEIRDSGFEIRETGGAHPASRIAHPASLSSLTGWWNSIAAGDFDGDGRLDLIAGNWGENTGYQKHLPLQVHFGDFDDNGVFDVLEAAFDRALNQSVPLGNPSVVVRSLPGAAARFGSYTAYGRASVEEVIGRAASVATARTLSSMLWLNRGDRFEARPLPVEAQLAPVFGIGVADFDGDGHEDALLAQNFFAVEPMTSRYDAGRGVLLLGRGDGTFRAAPAAESGVAVYGEGRGVAVCDYDGDGRVDACLGQNGAQTKLYRNTGAAPGLRVRLRGPAANPAAIGAQIRPVRADGSMGPARELRAGGGWLSQDGAVQVFGARENLRGFEVRWPGGRVTRVTVPADAKEIEIETTGQVEAMR